AQANDALGYLPQSFELNPVAQQGLGFFAGGYLIVNYEDSYAIDRCFGDAVLEHTPELLAAPRPWPVGWQVARSGRTDPGPGPSGHPRRRTHGGSRTMSASAWETVLDRLDAAAKLGDVDPDIHRILRIPERVLEVAVPVKMDDGRIEVFTGWRVHHDTTRGPGKGGIRFHPAVDADEVKA